MRRENRTFSPVANLITLLEEVKKKTSIQASYDGETNHYFLDMDDVQVAAVSELASYVLFDGMGRIQHEEKVELHRNGYRTIMVRTFRDNLVSGWLIAGIEIPFRGVIAFENDFLFEHIENKKLEQQMKGEF